MADVTKLLFAASPGDEGVVMRLGGSVSGDRPTPGSVSLRPVRSIAGDTVIKCRKQLG